MHFINHCRRWLFLGITYGTNKKDVYYIRNILHETEQASHNKWVTEPNDLIDPFKNWITQLWSTAMGYSEMHHWFAVSFFFFKSTVFPLNSELTNPDFFFSKNV